MQVQARTGETEEAVQVKKVCVCVRAWASSPEQSHLLIPV